MNQQDRLFLAQFFKVLGALVAFAIVLIFIARSMGGVQRDWVADDPLIQARTDERIAPIGEVVTDPGTLPETPSTQPEIPTSPVEPQLVGADIYARTTCGGCHNVGLVGAPRPGNVADWTPRLAQGIENVYRRALEGIPGTIMAARGGTNLSDAEIRAVVDYMVPQTLREAPTTPPETPVQPEIPPTQPETPVVPPTQPETPALPPVDLSLATEETSETSACADCHGSGREGAPVVGALEDWAPRLPQGRATLYRHAIEGFGNMPERGGRDDLTDGEVRAMVEYMLAQLPVNIDALPPPTGALGEQIYTVYCQVCHAPNSPMGAPRLGNVADWAPRIAQGIATLYEHAINGFIGTRGVMPARGGISSLTNAEVQAAVDHMVAQIPAQSQPEPTPEPEPETPETSPADDSASPAMIGMELYTNNCAACHATGHIEAPILGDLEHWQDRIAQGIETLYEHAIEGFGGMPPRGGTNLTDEEIQAVVDFMVDQVQ